jgi:hypothetical protein
MSLERVGICERRVSRWKLVEQPALIASASPHHRLPSATNSDPGSESPFGAHLNAVIDSIGQKPTWISRLTDVRVACETGIVPKPPFRAAARNVRLAAFVAMTL